MPRPRTFDTRVKTRKLLRYTLCWGLPHDHEEFRLQLQEDGITASGKPVKSGAIRLELLGYLGKHWFRYLLRHTIKDGKSTIFEVRLRILKDEASLLENRLRSSKKTFDLTNYGKIGTSDRSAIACEEFIDPWTLSSDHHDASMDVLRTGSSFFAANNDDFEDNHSEEIIVSPIDSRIPVKPQASKRLERATLMSEPSVEEEFSRIAETSSIVRWRQDTVDAIPKFILSRSTRYFQTDRPDLDRVQGTSSGTSSIRESVRRRLGSVKEFSISGREGEDVANTRDSGITSSEAYETLTRLFCPSKQPDHQHRTFEDLQKYFPRRHTVVYPLELCRLDLADGCSRCSLPPLRHPSRDPAALRTLFVEKLVADSFGNTGFHYAVALEQNNVVGWMKTLPWDDLRAQKQSILCSNAFNQTFLFALQPGGFEFCMDKLSELLHFVRLQQPEFDFNHQDCHGQTWLHQLFNNNDWSFRTWTLPYDCLTETDNIPAVEVLRLRKSFGINPCIRDNFNRTVLQFLANNAGDELSESNEPGIRNSLSGTEDVLKPYMLAHWAEHAASYVDNWTNWLETVSGDDHVLENIVLAVRLADFISLGFYDTEGNTLLLAYIAYIDPCTMLVKDVERALEIILQRLPRTDMRNAVGETPLHLASRLGHPHVVTMLLRHGASLAVENYNGISLPTDLRTAYREARESDEPNAVFPEADLMICTCIITNAANGDLPDPDHEFRPLREFYHEADGAFKGREARKRRLHDATLQRAPRDLNERIYEWWGPVCEQTRR